MTCMCVCALVIVGFSVIDISACETGGVWVLDVSYSHDEWVMPIRVPSYLFSRVLISGSSGLRQACPFHISLAQARH